jgi:hypothetical protein
MPLVTPTEMEDYFKRVTTWIHDALKGASIIPSESLHGGDVVISLDLLEKMADYELSENERERILSGRTHIGYLLRMNLYCDKDPPPSSVMINSHLVEILKRYTE